jgi:hypothetical protein
MKWKICWFAFECGYVDPYDCMILMILMILMIFGMLHFFGSSSDLDVTKALCSCGSKALRSHALMPASMSYPLF